MEEGLPVGTAGCPRHRSEFPAPPLLSFPPAPAKKAQRPKAGVGRPPQVRALPLPTSPLPAQSPHLKRALLGPQVEAPLALTSDSRSIFGALVPCASPLARSKSPIDVYRRRGRQRLWPEEGLNLVENPRSPRQAGVCVPSSVFFPH